MVLMYRDPKAETDFWRSAAKELSTDGSGSNIGASEGNDKIDIGSDESGEDKSAWDSWTNARKDWETQLENAQERDPKKVRHRHGIATLSWTVET